MPATERSWRDLMILHVVFVAAALVLRVSTVAMLAAGGGILPAKGLRRRRRSPEGVKGRDASHT